MLRTGRLRSLLLFVIALAILVPVAAYAYQCNYYSDTRVINVSGYGNVCGGFGSGCTECWDSQSGASCVKAGFSNCMQEEHQN